MNQLRDERIVREEWPEANLVVHYLDAWLIKSVKHNFGDPVYAHNVLGKSLVSAEDAWHDAAQRIEAGKGNDGN